MGNRNKHAYRQGRFGHLFCGGGPFPGIPFKSAPRGSWHSGRVAQVFTKGQTRLGNYQPASGKTMAIGADRSNLAPSIFQYSTKRWPDHLQTFSPTQGLFRFQTPVIFLGIPSKPTELLPTQGLSVVLFGNLADKDHLYDIWNNALAKNSINGSIILCPWQSDWNTTMVGVKCKIDKPWTLLVPLDASSEILDWIQNHAEAIGKLDGVSFRRLGEHSPWTLRLLSWVFYYPIRFLLELPLTNEDSWLGWSNWFWELQGYWLLGVRNHDPLNPLRLLRTEWFKRIPFQSRTTWGNLEMLAKAHFLGARLAEEISPISLEVLPPNGNIWKDLTQLIREPCFTEIKNEKESLKNPEITGSMSPNPEQHQD
mgnify:CR=1 FL=1